MAIATVPVAGCASMRPAARPGDFTAGATVAASVLFRIGTDQDGSATPPEDVGCFEKIEGNTRETICPP